MDIHPEVIIEIQFATTGNIFVARQVKHLVTIEFLVVVVIAGNSMELKGKLYQHD